MLPLDPALLAVTVEDPGLTGFLAAIIGVILVTGGVYERTYNLRNTALVLIIGCFPAERKAIQDALCASVRARGYEPVVCDGECLATFDLSNEIRNACRGISLVKILAHLSDFVLVDLTGLRAFDERPDVLYYPEESMWEGENEGVLGMLEDVVDYSSSPFQLLLDTSHKDDAEGMNFSKYRRVLPLYGYKDAIQLKEFLQEEGFRAIEKAIGVE
jgi:hypothetical protein